MKNALFIPEQRTPHFYLPSHTVTWEQDLSHLKKKFSQKELQKFLELYALAQEKPRRARKEIEAFRNDHPDHPEVLNLLTYLYIFSRKIRKGDQLIEENYKKNPEYFIGKINFADLCLRRKNPEKIPEIFNHKWNLTEMFPSKKIFHISEFRGFMIIMGLYHLSIGKREAAECYHYLAARVSPSHPSTRMLAKKLYYVPFYKKIGSKLFKPLS